MIHASCYHFLSQDVFQTEHEPLAFCSSQGKILIATVENNVRIHDLDSRGKFLHSFLTVDQVIQIIYCNAGNYIATLERKQTSHSSPVTYVRIYFNWWIDTRGQPVKIHIAGSSPLTNCEMWTDHFKMIQLPLNKAALCIACCKTTAALGISLGKVISVFCYNSKPSDSLSHNQHDFRHFIDIELSFIVKEMNMCKNYFACMSDNQIQVFKVCVEKEDTVGMQADSKKKHNTPSNEVLDKYHVEWRFESCGSSSWEDELKGRLHKDSFPITVNFCAIEKENVSDGRVVKNCEIIGPSLTVKGHRVKVKLDPSAFELWPSLSSTNIDSVTLLYREFVLGEKGGKLMSLHLVSFYESDHYNEEMDPLHAAAVASQESFSSLPWSSSNLDAHPQLKAIGCFFSTVKKGFLYDVTEDTRLIGSYKYTSNLRSAVLDSMFLHALTDAGLETYTLHLSHCAFQYVENVDGVTNACPDFNSPICLFGLCPFLCASKLVMSENHLIVVTSLEESGQTTSTEEEEKSRTLYVLKKPSPQQVFSDLLETGQMSKASSPSTYHLLLTEGHVILRTYLYLCGNYDLEAESLYQKSCILLGDYYTCSSDSSVKHLATPYYQLSKLSVEEIVQRVLGFQKEYKHFNVLKALVSYLNCVLLNPQCSSSVSVSKGVAENILDIYLEESPDNLWRIIFCSELTNYRIEKAMLMLKRRITSKRHLQTVASIAADSIAIVSLLLKKGNTDSAQNMYLSMSKVDLVSMLVELHQFLWSDGLTSFGKFTKQVRPDAFIEMLLHMVKVKTTKVVDVIQMLQKEEPELEIHQVPQLKEFLEIMWNDCRSNPEVDADCQRLLVDIYLKRLSEATGPPISVAKSFTFGTRPQWLNEMPPFNGKSISRNCSLLGKENGKKNGTRSVSECCCLTCNEDLVKLQCLLVHPNSSKELHQHILEFLCSTKKKIRGHLSLEILCLEEDEAVNKLLDNCPSALFQFATDMFHNDEDKWCRMFTILLKKIKTISEQDPIHEVYMQSFHKILGHLSEILSVPKFISLLPRDKENDVYAPYVKRCCEKHQSRQLKNKIVALGNEIKAMMYMSAFQQ